MIGEGTKEIFITFLLAIIGYVGLTITLLFSFKRKVPAIFWRIVAVIIIAHVIMVWAYRYNWQFSLAIRNGYTGLIIFHSALLMILISAFVKENITKILIQISFIVVTIGAVGAVFRYEIVEIYMIPVLLCAIAGSIGLLWDYFRKLL
jgi:hypothetical protein